MTKTELIEEVQRLTVENGLLTKKYKWLQEKEEQMNEILSGSYFAPTANERGAGRKPIASDEIRVGINGCRAQGMTFRQISDKMGVSVGFIHKTYRSTL
jgi:hypothetical protein